MPNTLVNPDLKGYNFVDFRTPIWGDSYNWAFIRTFDQIIKLAIHHTVTQQKPGESNEQHAQYVANLHKNRGWAGIGYHFLIFRDGSVFYVGDILTGRANITNNNEKIIGISLIGDFTKELPSAHQILATNRLCDYFITKYPALKNVDAWDDVMGHQDAFALYKWPGIDSGTTCPSPAWRDPGDSLRNRIIEGNYKGYPDWENTKGVSVTSPTPPTPTTTPPPAPTPPPVPAPLPEVITDLTRRVLWKGQEVELRTLYEIIEVLNKSATRDAQVKGILEGKGWALTKYSNILKLYK